MYLNVTTHVKITETTNSTADKYRVSTKLARDTKSSKR